MPWNVLGTEVVNPNPQLVPIIVKKRLLQSAPFVLLDVGCSLGIGPLWGIFEDQLEAHGIDPQQDEIKRLQEAENRPNVRYYAFLVGLDEHHEFVRNRSEEREHISGYYNPFPRSSAIHAFGLQPSRPRQAAPINEALTTRKIGLAKFVDQFNVPNVDLIKIDTDGSDLEVAVSAAEMLQSREVLGFLIESPYIHSHHSTENTFHNIDRFMRQQGFQLYNLSVSRYSRKDLPAPFLYEMVAQTVFGQPIWGDLIYLRDGASPHYSKVWGEPLALPKILKLACLYDLFYLPDCAAELINVHHARIAEVIDPEILLDALTPEIHGKKMSYREYVSYFEKDPERFFPSAASARNEVPTEPVEHIADASGPLNLMEIVIDPATFESFDRAPRWVPGGYWGNWLGVLTRGDVGVFSQEVVAAHAMDRHQEFAYPTDNVDVLDWAPLLEAVLLAETTFVMAALGAGWGRWLSAGAFAAKQRGLRYQLVGVEAEPQHYRWMEIHLQENGIDPGSYRLLNAAASDHGGAGWFYVGKSASWYGQCIVPDKSVSLPWFKRVKLGYETTYGNERIRRTRCVDMQDVIGDLPTVDYLHMDIQGTEYDFLAANPGLLDQRVRMVNLGTHSAEIDKKLRDFFAGLRWSSRYDVSIQSCVAVRVGKDQGSVMYFEDGVQVWVNPRLSQP